MILVSVSRNKRKRTVIPLLCHHVTRKLIEQDGSFTFWLAILPSSRQPLGKPQMPRGGDTKSFFKGSVNPFCLSHTHTLSRHNNDGEKGVFRVLSGAFLIPSTAKMQSILLVVLACSRSAVASLPRLLALLAHFFPCTHAQHTHSHQMRRRKGRTLCCVLSEAARFLPPSPLPWLSSGERTSCAARVRMQPIGLWRSRIVGNKSD